MELAKSEYLAKLRQGIEKLYQGSDAWNQWRDENRELTSLNLSKVNLKEADLSGAYLNSVDLNGVDISGANLSGANLCHAMLIGANLSNANLSSAILSWANLGSVNFSGAEFSGAYFNEADLSGAKLNGADLRGAYLPGAKFGRAYLSGANLSGASLCGAYFNEADLSGADLSGADLSGADLNGASLERASFVGTILDDARLDSCRVYGTSVWDVSLKNTTQRDLVITDHGAVAVTVDNIKLAQFIYLLLKNDEIRHIIDTITSKVVIILGRFTDERKKVLDALRQELRARDYTPILFDFEKPASRDLTETLLTLASMSRFVIADISAAKSIPQELSHIIPHLPSVPVQPVLLASDREYAMFEHWKRYEWVLPDFLYQDEAHLLASLTDKVIAPAEQKRREQINV